MALEAKGCNGCGMQVVVAAVAKSEDMVILDAAQPVYHVVEDGENMPLALQGTRPKLLALHQCAGGR